MFQQLKNLFKPDDWYPVWSKTYTETYPPRSISGWSGETIVVDLGGTTRYTNIIVYSPSRKQYKLDAFKHHDGYDESVAKLNELQNEQTR